MGAEGDKFRQEALDAIKDIKEAAPEPEPQEDAPQGDEPITEQKQEPPLETPAEEAVDDTPADDTSGGDADADDTSSVIPEHLMRQAEEAGISKEDAEKYGEMLPEMLAHRNRWEVEFARKEFGTTEKPEPTEPPKPTDFEPTFENLDKVKDDMDEGVYEAMKADQKANLERIAQFSDAKSRQAEEREQVREQATQKAAKTRVEQWFHSEIDKLPDNYAAVLGRTDALTEGQKMARQSLMRDHFALGSLHYSRDGAQEVPDDHFFTKALNGQYADIAVKIEQDVIREKLKKRQGLVMQKPSSRKTSSGLSTTDETIQKVEAILEKKK